MLYAYNQMTGEYSMTLPFETEIKEGLTDVAPPKGKEGYTNVFNPETNKWKTIRDYRFTHKMLKDGEVYTIEDLGEIPEDYTLITNAEAEILEEQIRINKLTMTPLDFIGVLQSFGITLEEIDAYLNSNLAVKTQLTYCNSVYCGVAKSLMPIILGVKTVTAKMVEEAFRVKNNDYADSEVTEEII